MDLPISGSHILSYWDSTWYWIMVWSMVMKPFWIVWSNQVYLPCTRFNSKEEAIAQAKKDVRLEKDIPVFIMQAIGKVERDDTKYTELDNFVEY